MSAGRIPGRDAFPPGFLLGVASSAYQIEGHAAGGAGPTHWDSFAATPGNVARAEDGALACDHLIRWPEDLDLAAAMGADVWRFSTSWARVQPEGCGTVNAQGLDFYDRLVDGMLARGLKPALTLYHWELPSALGDTGGWANRETCLRFADYAGLMADRLGDRVWSWAPVNEPWCVAWMGYFLGHFAPGLRDIRAAARAMHHVGLAHGLAIGALRAAGAGNLGAVVNMEHAAPADDSPEAAAAAYRYDGIYNRWFMGGFLRGEWDADTLRALEPHMPAGWQEDMATIAAPVDWLGLNYYTRKLCAPAPPGTPWPALDHPPGPLPKTDIGWEIYPEGLGGFLRRIHAAAPGLPIHVTESGLACAAEPDTTRIAYLAAHLDQVRAVIAEGVDVRGYYAWSILDNYEWADGYDQRFGLVHVDFASQIRRPRASWHELQRGWGR